MKLTFWIFILLCIGACQPQAYNQLKKTSVSTEAFGDKVKNKKTVSLASIKEQLVTTDTLFVSSVGKVSKVCQQKGCWMTISPEGGSDPVFMVKFKDYGFFVPKDISGETVVLQGKAFRQVTDVETLRHFAEDAGKSQSEIDAITEPKEELIFIADGVELFRQKS